MTATSVVFFGILAGLAGAAVFILLFDLVQFAAAELRAWRIRRRGVQP